MTSNNPLFTIFFLSLGILLVIIWLLYYNLTHQKEIKAALKSKQTVQPFSQKLASNYNSKEKHFAIFVGIYVLSLGILSLNFYLKKNLFATNLVLALIPVSIPIILKLGDSITKQ